MPRLRLTKIDEYQFLTCLKHSLWGSKNFKFKDWKKGDYLVIKVDKCLAGLAVVNGEPFKFFKRIWEDDIYPHRIPIKFSHIVEKEKRPQFLGKLRDALIKEWGTGYGLQIRNQTLLTGEPAEIVLEAIQICPNSLPDFISNLENYLVEAKLEREASAQKGGEKAPKPVVPAKIDLPESSDDMPEHSRAQFMLIALGRIFGCSVWIASNDRNKVINGKPLGDGCLKSLPNLGLSDEATKRISLIDVIWLKQNAPVCAFEVETTTSVYSGLLRMSDLISVVPALNVDLYIIAQQERQRKVIAELSRPTFQKIGLNEYCKFISTEELENLIKKVKDLGGYVQPSIINKIAIAAEEI